VTELMVPRDIRLVEALPVLGTGKLDYVTMSDMALLVPGNPVANEPDDMTEGFATADDA
jgi:acyl-[acyl-carrier-protein]-phospholipid O-acyltransferase/long-chain-fatty-acid--[acyl-carrier-protein] ligase